MNVQYIDDAALLPNVCARVSAATLVSLDTEFHNERTYAARLMVVQLVAGDDVFLVDPLKIEDLSPLAVALESTTVVGHALQSDLKILADRFDRLPGRAFDTQLAAAFCGYGMSISLADLVNAIVGVRLKKSHTVSDWSMRPLSPQQIEYLVDDVIHLPALHDALRERLVASGRLAWFEEESASLTSLDRYKVDTERLYLRISGAMRMNRRELGILREVALLRDRLARDRDVPLKFILADDIMVSIVQLRPKTRDDLAQLRRLDGGMRKAYGDRIVEAVARGLALPDDDLPRKPARAPGLDREPIVAALGVLVNAIATENELPAGLLLPRSTLERVARELPLTLDDFERALDTSGWRTELLARPLHEMLQGRTALAIRGAETGDPQIERVAL
jgi:ribonuclease D